MPSLGVFLAETGGTASALQDAFKAGIEAVATDVMGFATVALPVALGIVGLFLAVRYGMKFFKTVSK